MTDVLDDVRDHDRATGLSERLKTALVALGAGFAERAANLGRNLLQGRLGILSAVFEAKPISN